jgi:hypothetical protein
MFVLIGITSARLRHTRILAENYISSISTTTVSSNSNNILPSGNLDVESLCFHRGYSEPFKVDEQTYPLEPTSPLRRYATITITGPTHVYTYTPTNSSTIYTTSNSNNNDISINLYKSSKPYITNQFEACKDILRVLIDKEEGRFCEEVYHGDCSIAGSYQPPLPHVDNTSRYNFIGTSTYKYAWTFLQLPETANLYQFEEAASKICSMTYPEIANYYNIHNLNNDNDKMTDIIPYSCFIASYISVLLQGMLHYHC